MLVKFKTQQWQLSPSAYQIHIAQSFESNFLYFKMISSYLYYTQVYCTDLLKAFKIYQVKHTENKI